MKRPSRRKYNNILMIAVLVFIGVLQAPQLIKTYLLEPEQAVTVNADVQPLFERINPIKKMHFADYDVASNTSDQDTQFIERWFTLEGTLLTDESVKVLKTKLPAPSSVEVWFENQEEPQRITIYQAPNFWMMQNWQGEWIAVSAEEEYLFRN
ncbi:hypothetical protein [Aliivibrio sifiae]|uniref:50S ribosomal protein L33 n=1 Tax=Aliivibrio sifiae TaxID=566293 RepID=A0A2S7X5A3_9GAMM|nr:hypothetical protein [Aliivibrio sifiae]PQJ85437.1 hypothetical protein BTO23_19155 [Aliivibrio sifiae]GLR76380.1 hypothetical protein GCM10007855_32550 [Aliivibrio sifiae]